MNDDITQALARTVAALGEVLALRLAGAAVTDVTLSDGVRVVVARLTNDNGAVYGHTVVITVE